MLRKIAIGALLASLLLIAVACSSPTSTPTPALMPTPATAQARPSAPTDFQIAELVIDQAEVTSGEKVFITASVINTSDADGAYIAELGINDITEAVQEVTVPAGGIEIVRFSVSRDILGTYELTLGELTRQFVVTESPTPTQADNPEPTTPIYCPPAAPEWSQPIRPGCCGG